MMKKGGSQECLEKWWQASIMWCGDGMGYDGGVLDISCIPYLRSIVFTCMENTVIKCV